MAILVIGLASDGADNTVENIKSKDDIENKYVTNYKEVNYKSPGTDTMTLDFTPLSLPRDSVNDLPDTLLNKSLTTNTLSFVFLGGSVDQKVELHYQPYYGASDLAMALTHCMNAGIKTYGAKVAGAVATVTPITGLTFNAKTSGKKYNRAKVSITGNDVTFYGMTPAYPVRTVTFVTADSFIQEVGRLCDIGVLPVYCSACPASMSNGTGTLSGGTDSTMTAAQLLTCLDTITVPVDVEVVLILGNPAASVCEKIYNFVSEYNHFSVFTQAPVISYPISTWATNFYNSSYKHQAIFYGAGEVKSIASGNILRNLSEAAAINFIKQKEQLAFANMPLQNWDLGDEFTAAELELITSAGVFAATRRIFNGVCLYKTTNSTNVDALKRLCASIVSRIASNTLYKYLGSPLPSGRSSFLEGELEVALRNELPRDVTYLENITEVSKDEILTEIKVRIYDEILDISFGISY